MKKPLLTLLAFLLTACSNSNQAPPDLNMVISVSGDGNYALTTNTNKQAILWNLKDHSYKIIFRDANIYSAYFIKNTNDFIYQNDKTNEVVVENVNGQIIKTFNPGFPTYGEIMTSDLSTYYAVDQNDQVFKVQNAQTTQFLWHYCDQNDPPIPAGVPHTCGSFPGDGKLFNLNLSPDRKYLITSGFGEVFVWNTQNSKMIQHIQKNDAQTIAAISPDGSYVVTGDIMNRAIKVNFNDIHNYQGFFFRFPLDSNQQNLYGEGASEIFALRFIDKNKALVFRHTLPNAFYYAALYDTTQMNSISGHPEWIFHNETIPLTYIPLINDPDNHVNDLASDNLPLISDDFSRDQAIDTSPSAHILVMSQQNASGIIVYKYDPQAQTLTREWAGEVHWWDNL